jgi:hypothetical protein
MNKGLIWMLFIAITLMQMQGNMYYAFKNLENYQSWVELFNLVDEDPLYQKRILSFVSGAILPLVALGFIKSLVDYIKPDENKPEVSTTETPLEESIEGMRSVVEAYDDLKNEIDVWDEASLTDLQNYEDIAEEIAEVEEEKAKIEDLIEAEILPEEQVEEMIDDVLEKEESLESKIQEDLTNDYLLGKEIYQNAIKRAVRADAIKQARKEKLERLENTIESIESIEENKEVSRPKVSRTGVRGAGTVGMY